MPANLDLSPDHKRTIATGAKTYHNCLAFAMNIDVTKTTEKRCTDLCMPFFGGFDNVSDFHMMMALVFAKPPLVNKRTFQVAGTTSVTPTRYAQQIADRRLIGVGQDGDNGDLHFYVVTQSNGDGQGICGRVDAQTNTVLPCRLRNNMLIQHSGTSPGNPHRYNLRGFIVIPEV